MAFNVQTLKRELYRGEYVAPERICLAANGELASCEDPRATSLLVGAGSTLSREEAARYGLVAEPDDGDQEVETPAPGAEFVLGRDPVADLVKGNIPDVQERIGAVEDIDLLQAARELDTRKRVHAAIDARIDELNSSRPVEHAEE